MRSVGIFAVMEITRNEALKLKITVVTTICLGIYACGGGSSEPDNTVLTGVFVDSAVKGAAYSTATQSGTTNSEGQFNYMAGEQVTFSIGDTQLPTVNAASRVSPVDMATGSSDPAATTTNIARLLQSLDDDGNPDNGIVIPDTAAGVAASIDFSQSSVDFQNDPAVVNLVSNSGSLTTVLISAQQANNHLNATLGSQETTAPINEPFSVAQLNNRYLIPTPSSFAAGRSGFRFDAGSDVHNVDIGDTDDVLRYFTYPWSVAEGGVLTLNFESIVPGLICRYTRTELVDELIELNVICSEGEVPGTPQYYLSKPISTADLDGKSYAVDGSETIRFNGQGSAQFVFADGATTMINYGRSDFQALELVLVDSGETSQLVLLSGSVDNGLLMRWDYNEAGQFIRVTFFSSNSGAWSTLGEHSIQ